MKLSKVYEPGLYETDIYALWEKTGAFAPSGVGKPYAIVMPPPNANANLHIGAGLTFALEDIAARYHRLKGDNTLFLPGADHAGFETQSVYEKKLAKEGKSRFNFSREELYRNIYDFVAQNRSNFETQMRRIGVSADWSRFTFTLDDKVVKRAYATFKKMWDEGLIYRGERPVNYCTFHRTGFADIEVEYEDAESPLYYIKYGPFTLATTRPETTFGDTAVAVHPDDDRYKDLVGKTVTIEGVNGAFEVRVVADEMVDPAFGTGAVKVTPAHSFDDWDIAKRHNLSAVRVINHDGTMNHLSGRFEGMTVMEARTAVAAAMKEQGMLVKVDQQYQNRLGKCYKCGTVIEPMLMEQWFAEMQPLAQPAIKALEANQITFYPEAKKDQLAHYLEGIRDWNISRQIAWGIPIPAFQNVDDRDDWIYDEHVDQETIEIRTETGDTKTYRRDPDVFDTWFSSSSWPYATLNYGSDDDSDFNEFYPLGLMETGGEILYPWVSRMVMLGLYVTGKVPFEAVYIHGYVMAEDGSKMSKSIGNVVDPIPVIDEFGSDALRMGIIAGRTAAVNRGYDTRKVADARNFCNKLWNIARYVEDKVGDSFNGRDKAIPASVADHWVLSKLQQSTEVIASHLDSYRFAEAYEALYHFVWDDIADWYIEASKSAPNNALLAYCLECVLKLMHPFAPFVTETIWQTLAWETKTDGDISVLATQQWPEIIHFEKSAAADFDELQTIITEIRFITKALGVSDTTLYYNDSPLLTASAELIKRLTRLSAVTQVTDGSGVYLTSTSIICWLDIDRTTAAAYADKLTEKQADTQAVINRLEGRLNNTSYVDGAPQRVVDQTRAQLAEAQQLLSNIIAEADRFKTV